MSIAKALGMCYFELFDSLTAQPVHRTRFVRRSADARGEGTMGMVVAWHCC
jgi:hypothetical protein